MDLDKLDKDLRAFVEEAHDRTETVIIELDLPRLQVKVAPSRLDPRRRGMRPIEVIEDPGEAERVAGVFSAAIARIRQVTGRDPKPLRAAQALIVKLTPAELRALSDEPFVRAFHRNAPATGKA